MIDKDHHADADGAVCNVKGRPVVGAEIKIKEINYFSVNEPVNEVADCTAEYQCQPKG